jgi:hypothetical protein
MLFVVIGYFRVFYRQVIPTRDTIGTYAGRGGGISAVLPYPTDW